MRRATPYDEPVGFQNCGLGVIDEAGLIRPPRFGEVVAKTELSIKLRVKRERVIATCKELLDQLPVQDIDIQEVPIEEIIRQIFAR